MPPNILQMVSVVSGKMLEPFIHTMVKCRGVIRNLNAEQHELSKSVEVRSSQ
jgi:hypothetical protein